MSLQAAPGHAGSPSKAWPQQVRARRAAGAIPRDQPHPESAGGRRELDRSRGQATTTRAAGPGGAVMNTQIHPAIPRDILLDIIALARCISMLHESSASRRALMADLAHACTD